MTPNKNKLLTSYKIGVILKKNQIARSDMSHRSKNRNTRVPNTNRRLSFQKTSYPQSRSLQSPTFSPSPFFPSEPALKKIQRFAPQVIPAVIHQQVQQGPKPFGKIPLPENPAQLQKVLSTCVRRNQRREVMFAKGGAGSRKMSRPKHTQQSTVRC